MATGDPRKTLTKSNIIDGKDSDKILIYIYIEREREITPELHGDRYERSSGGFWKGFEEEGRERDSQREQGGPVTRGR